MAAVREAGRALFGDNCSVCHGRDARAARAFPTSRRRRGCGAARPRRSPRPSASASTRPIPKSRVSQMPAFGRDGMLKRHDIENVVAYVLSLSRREGVGRQCRGRQDRVHGELRRLPRPRRQGQDRRRSARPHRPRTGPMAATKRRSTTTCGAACRGRCRAGKAGCRRSIGKSSPSTSPTSGSPGHERAAHPPRSGPARSSACSCWRRCCCWRAPMRISLYVAVTSQPDCVAPCPRRAMPRQARDRSARPSLPVRREPDS